jgi:4-amino-4-deoxy-L-arabinose transferase-like glycosyltransferase
VNPQSRGDRPGWRVLLMVGLFLLVGTVSLVGTPHVRMVADACAYDALGANLAYGRGYTLTGSGPSAWRVPGYPLFLAAVYACVGHNTLAVRVVQVVVAGLTVWVTYRLALAAFGDPRAALWAALLAAVCPTTLLFAHLILTETLFTGLLATGFFVAFAWRHEHPARYFGAGAILGVAALVRPIGATLVLSLPVLLLAERQRPTAALSRAATAWLGCVLVMAPWWYRNWQVFDAFIATDLTAGIDLFMGNNDEAQGRYRFARGGELLPRAPDDLSLDRIARQRALRWIQTHPARFIRILPGKIMAFWGVDRDGLFFCREGFWGGRHRLGLVALGPAVLGIAILLPMALVTMIVGGPREPIRWMLWPLLSFWMVSTISVPQARIHAPLVPMLAALAGRCVAERHWRMALRPERWRWGILAFWSAFTILVGYWAWEIAEATAQTFR